MILQAGVAWPNPRFVDNGNSTITDNLTGLMWTKDANLPSGTISWQQALDYVANMNSGNGTYGYNDWRLPNIVELDSLQNQGARDFIAWLTGQRFANVQVGACWSSTSYSTDPSYAWIFLLIDQNLFYGPKADTQYVNLWPVRGGQCGIDTSVTCLPKTGQTITYYPGDDGALQKGVAWPTVRFSDNGNGTVTDNLTGLMWTKDAYPAGMTKTWQQALDYVKTVNTGTYTDWRLPNRKELRSLIDYSQLNPALPQGHPFTNVQQSPRYCESTSWQSTEDPPVGVWEVGMRDGGNFDGLKEPTTTYGQCAADSVGAYPQ